MTQAINITECMRRIVTVLLVEKMSYECLQELISQQQVADAADGQPYARLLAVGLNCHR
jgi:hypothetical protein